MRRRDNRDEDCVLGRNLSAIMEGTLMIGIPTVALLCKSSEAVHSRHEKDVRCGGGKKA